MNRIEEIHFHDSEVLNVTVYPEKREVFYLLSYPSDWENNVYENKTLKFFGVSLHEINEGDVEGNPTLLDVVVERIGNKTKLVFDTTAGKRSIEFESFIFE